MDYPIANRTKNVKPSMTLALNARAKAMRTAGEDVISLSVGEPDFPTPKHICDAGIAAIRDGQTLYTAVDGTAELKKAIIDKFQRENSLTYKPDQIIASTGGKQALFNMFLAMINPGDEVIIPAPYWVSYPDMVSIAEGQPVIVETSIDEHFKMTADQLEAAITNKTRLLVLNSPSNPTGSVYSKSELLALANVLKKHPQVIIISDDIYEHILWGDEPFCNIVMACPELYDRTIILNGASKCFAMTGWRLGYAAGPEAIIKVMKKIQSQSTSNPSSVTQAAVVAALNGDQTCVKDMATAFKKRFDLIYPLLNDIDGIEVRPTQGAFYIFARAQNAIDRLGFKDDIELAEHLINKAKVAVVPGSAFGSPGYFRLSYAASEDTLKEAILRIKNAL